MRRVALLDINVLVALFDPDHVHHEAAHRWFAKERRGGWATCPISENGVVRILSNASYVDPPQAPLDAAERLQQFCESGDHEFWPDEVSIRELRPATEGFALSHKQITDVYLLALAHYHDGRLVTFDRSIPIAGVQGATSRHLEIIAA
jgi:toxin-antitoxin system PIN domain toxin